MPWPNVFEWLLVVTAWVAMLAATGLAVLSRGWGRAAWSAIAAAYAWVTLGEMVLQLTGREGLILRWARSVPARTLIAVGLAVLFWRALVRKGRPW
jgi:hypothetical protein